MINFGQRCIVEPSIYSLISMALLPRDGGLTQISLVLRVILHSVALSESFARTSAATSSLLLPISHTGVLAIAD